MHVLNSVSTVVATGHSHSIFLNCIDGGATTGHPHLNVVNSRMQLARKRNCSDRSSHVPCTPDTVLAGCLGRSFGAVGALGKLLAAVEVLLAGLGQLCGRLAPIC